MGDEQREATVKLISSLISLSHSIRVFAGKWQLIRNKLEELHSGLTAGENQSLSGVFPAIAATVEECHELARRCVDLSYSGKLLMQSDLDVTLGKLEGHVKKLSEIYKKGILSNGYAVVVSRPCLGASKDDMRFYLRDLLTRIKVGDFGMKKQALINLHEVVLQDDKYVMLILQVTDFVHVLVDFLGSPEIEIQEESAKVVSVIVGFDSCKGVLIAAGVIAPLIRVLECGSELGKVGAARCLHTLTENSDNAWSVSAHGGVTALLKICESSDSKGELIGPICGVLRNLAGVEEIRGLWLRRVVIRDGGIRVFLRVLDPKWTCSSKTREVVMRAVENLYFLHLVLNGEVSIQELVLKVAFRLCGTSEEAKKALGDAGFMAELVKFLNAKSFEVREMAAETLSGMVMVPKK
ncbi:Armadillo-type fold [Sesbania bispinosa]|nr:Armadillo-type fold [Sesbania bispinosa]